MNIFFVDLLKQITAFKFQWNFLKYFYWWEIIIKQITFILLKET